MVPKILAKIKIMAADLDFGYVAKIWLMANFEGWLRALLKS